MGRSNLLPFLLLSTLFFLSISPGVSRKLVESSSYSLPDSLMQQQNSGTKGRNLMIELMDYGDNGNAHANEAHNANVIPEHPYNTPALSPDNKDR